MFKQINKKWLALGIVTITVTLLTSFARAEDSFQVDTSSSGRGLASDEGKPKKKKGPKKRNADPNDSASDALNNAEYLKNHPELSEQIETVMTDNTGGTPGTPNCPTCATHIAQPQPPLYKNTNPRKGSGGTNKGDSKDAESHQ